MDGHKQLMILASCMTLVTLALALSATLSHRWLEFTLYKSSVVKGFSSIRQDTVDVKLGLWALDFCTTVKIKQQYKYYMYSSTNANTSYSFCDHNNTLDVMDILEPIDMVKSHKGESLLKVDVNVPSTRTKALTDMFANSTVYRTLCQIQNFNSIYRLLASVLKQTKHVDHIFFIKANCPHTTLD